MNIDYFINSRNLINARPGGRFETDENTMLFSNMYQILTAWNDKDLTIAQHAFLDFMVRMDWHKNVVPDKVPDSHKGDLYLSRDQMFSYCLFSKLHGRQDHKIIWKRILKGFFTYDNVSKKFNLARIVRPRDWIFIGYLNSNKLCWCLMPWYYFTGLFTFLTGGNKQFSGEHLYFHNYMVDEHPLRNLFFKIYSYLLGHRTKSKNGWSMMLQKYYGEGHPITKIAKERVK